MTIENTILIGIAILFLIGWVTACRVCSLLKDRNDILEMDNVGLEHYNHMLKNKLQKKKEVLEMQDQMIADSKHDFKFDAIILKKSLTMENNHGIIEFQAPYNYEAITYLDTKRRVNVTVKYIN